MENKTEFRVGDRVSWCGSEGKITKIKADYDEDIYPIKVNFDGDDGFCFTRDGKYLYSRKEPSLKLIERPKRYETVTIERWVNVYHDYISCFYETEESANYCALSDRTACVKLTGSYEREIE